MPRRKAAKRVDGTHRGEAEISYVLERVAGADTLLVMFPKMQLGPTRPDLGLSRYLVDIRAHRLGIGADKDTFMGPEGSYAGLHTAVDLIRAQAEELGVAHERVICLGTSFSGAFAVQSALLGGAGRAIGAGVPFRGGTSLLGLVARSRDTGRKLSARKEIAPALLALVKRSPDDDPVAFLDSRMFDAAETVTAPCVLDLFTSEKDFTHRSVLEFAEFAADKPGVTVRVHHTDYDQHGGGPLIYQQFETLLEALLAA